MYSWNNYLWPSGYIAIRYLQGCIPIIDIRVIIYKKRFKSLLLLCNISNTTYEYIIFYIGNRALHVIIQQMLSSTLSDLCKTVYTLNVMLVCWYVKVEITWHPVRSVTWSKGCLCLKPSLLFVSAYIKNDKVLIMYRLEHFQYTQVFTIQILSSNLLDTIIKW